MVTASVHAINATKGRIETGADELRLIVRNIDATRESFLERFTAEELLQLFRMQLASGWDFYPDQWTARQVAEALRGVVPTWTDDECPVYLTPCRCAFHSRRGDANQICGE